MSGTDPVHIPTTTKVYFALVYERYYPLMFAARLGHQSIYCGQSFKLTKTKKYTIRLYYFIALVLIQC